MNILAKQEFLEEKISQQLKKIIEIISKYCRGNVKFLIVKNIYYVKMSKNQIQI